MRYVDSVLELIGNTPLVRLSKVTAGLAPTVLAKVEYFNPGGSVKDRIALRMVEAAEASGVSRWRIISRHIIPNCLGPVVVYVTLTVPSVILTESFISFLGMGVQEPDSSWGTLVSEAAVVMEIAPWAIIGTGSMLAITLLCLNFIGDGLRDALDPKDR